MVMVQRCAGGVIGNKQRVMTVTSVMTTRFMMARPVYNWNAIRVMARDKVATITNTIHRIGKCNIIVEHAIEISVLAKVMALRWFKHQFAE